MNRDDGPDNATSKSRLALLLSGGALLGVLMAAAVILMGPGRIPGRAVDIPTPIPDNVAAGKPAPEFRSVTSEGAEIALSDYRGEPVAVNFWATWCGPCRVEMPTLQRAYEDGKIMVLAVNAGESEELVDAYMAELGLTFPAVMDPDEAIQELYAIRVYPTTVWINSDGIIEAEHYGPLTDEAIDQYLADLNSSN